MRVATRKVYRGEKNFGGGVKKGAGTTSLPSRIGATDRKKIKRVQRRGNRGSQEKKRLKTKEGCTLLSFSRILEKSLLGAKKSKRRLGDLRVAMQS